MNLYDGSLALLVVLGLMVYVALAILWPFRRESLLRPRSAQCSPGKASIGAVSPPPAR